VTRAGTGAARALAAAALAGAAFAGCGSSAPSVTPAAYVKSICGALGGWKSDVQNAGSKLQASGAGTATPPTAKRYYVEFVAALHDATQRATARLRAAGTPDVSSGKALAGDLTDAFARGTTGLAKAEAQARAIPTANSTVFEAAAGAVTSEIRTALQGIATISPRNSAALRSAAGKEPACQALNG